MRLCILLFLNIFSFYNSIQAQNSFDEKEYAFLQNEIRRLASSYPDSALIVADKLEKSINVEQKIFAKGSIAYLLQLKGDVSKTDQKLDEAIKLSEKMANSKEKYKSLAYLYNYMGLINRLRGKLSTALLKLNEGVGFSKKGGDIKQAIKMEMNIAAINFSIENYQSAIKSLKKSELLIQKNNFLFTDDEFLITKSNLFSDMGVNYEAIYKKDTSEMNKKYLDSSLFFYKKAVPYSKHIITNKINLQNNIAVLYIQLKKLDKAISIYQNIVAESTENNLRAELCIASYNLGYAYFLDKKYEKSLIYFSKVDSLYNLDESRLDNYTNSKYYQAKIYELKKDYDKAIYFSSIYLENLEKREFKLIEEKEKISSIQNNEVLKNEMKLVREKYGNQVLIKRIGLYSLFVLIALLIYFVVKNYRHRKIAEAKFNEIIKQYKKIDNESENEDNGVISTANIESKIENLQMMGSSLNLDEEKEIQLLQKLKELEEKEVFLNQDFTLQFVAKKIKTNTTYLSYVVNKNFEKTFSEYVNELKINYVINNMISNSLYRKYSTQAIAESVGYKNATSFARSFNKKTGLSPVQFAQKLEKLNDSNIKV